MQIARRITLLAGVGTLLIPAKPFVFGNHV
jgi:hypothetical protein